MTITIVSYLFVVYCYFHVLCSGCFFNPSSVCNCVLQMQAMNGGTDVEVIVRDTSEQSYQVIRCLDGVSQAQ